MSTHTTVTGAADLVATLRADGDYVWRLLRPEGERGWALVRRLPTGTDRVLLLPAKLGRELARRWGRTRRGRPVGQQSAGQIVQRLQAAPRTERADPYPVGGLVEHAGLRYTISTVVKGRAGRGYMRAFATTDAGAVRTDEPCTCPARRLVLAVDLVTELEVVVCAECRRVVQ